MSKLINWVCQNCGFIGRIGDRGISCCKACNPIDADVYYEQRMKAIRRYDKDHPFDRSTLPKSLQ